MAQTPTPISPLDQLKKDLATAQRDVNDLQKKVNLSTIIDRVEEIQNKVKGLGSRISDLRSNNYIFNTSLEQKAQDFQTRWSPIYTNVKVRANQESIHLKAEINQLESQLVRASSNSNNVALSRQILTPLNVSVKNLQQKVNASENMLRGLYNAFDSELNKYLRNLQAIEWTIKEFKTSNISLLAQEFLIMGVKAVWTKDGKEDKSDPEGTLYLTDQRLLFEQKEEVATKKILFITKERELKQELLVDIPLQYVETIKASKQGVFKNQDFLEINFGSGAQYSNTQFHIFNQDCDDWKGLLNSVIAGEFIEKRTKELDQEVIDKVKNAPTICPQCGATISIPVLRGMDQFKCEFCGAIIRL